MNKTVVVKRISLSNWLGITEKDFCPGKVNVLQGKKGAGKTSIIEALEKAIAGKLDGADRRKELVRHGEEEATIFLELSDGLNINRKIRAESNDYLRVSKEGESVPSTEKFLRSLFKGDLFRPGEFLKKTAEEQASIILNMLEIDWNSSDIRKWFGEIPQNIDFNLHILKVLKQIEEKYYKERRAVNQEIDLYDAQVKGHMKNLPDNYDGEHWKTQDVGEHFKAVMKAEEINRKIEKAKEAIGNIEIRIQNLKNSAEIEKNAAIQNSNLKKDSIKQDIQKIRDENYKYQLIINTSDEALNEEYKEIYSQLELEIEKLKVACERKKDEARRKIEANNANLEQSIHQNKLEMAKKEQESSNEDLLLEKTIGSIESNLQEKIKVVNAETDNAKKTLEENPEFQDVESLRKNADHVARMQSFVREYDAMNRLIDEQLNPLKAKSNALTEKIETARSLPLELLKKAKCPIDGISVDESGNLRINKTLISHLSDGEKKELAIKIAKQRALDGELKVICFDGFQDLNPSEQAKLIEEAKTDGFQYFILITTDGELKIDILDSEGAN